MPKGWIHLAHGFRNTAAGLMYVIYLYVTALEDIERVAADRLLDYAFNTPHDEYTSNGCVKQRIELIRENLEENK